MVRIERGGFPAVTISEDLFQPVLDVARETWRHLDWAFRHEDEVNWDQGYTREQAHAEYVKLDRFLSLMEVAR